VSFEQNSGLAAVVPVEAVVAAILTCQDPDGLLDDENDDNTSERRPPGRDPSVLSRSARRRTCPAPA
jgi:hypothetical protein